MPALAVNIIIVHPWDVVFPLAKALGKTTPLRWTLMMFTISADNNCIMSCISTLLLVVSESSSLSPCLRTSGHKNPDKWKWLWGKMKINGLINNITRVYINYNQLNEKYTSLYKRLNPIWNRLVNDSLLNDLLNTVQEENKDIPTLLVNIRTM